MLSLQKQQKGQLLSSCWSQCIENIFLALIFKISLRNCITEMNITVKIRFFPLLPQAFILLSSTAHTSLFCLW